MSVICVKILTLIKLLLLHLKEKILQLLRLIFQVEKKLNLQILAIILSLSFDYSYY